MSDVTHVRRWDGKEDCDDPKAMTIPANTVVYEINGPMFFADADKFLDFSLDHGTKTVILRMGSVPSVDATAMKNLEILRAVCSGKGIRLVLSHVQDAPLSVMKKAGFYERVGAESFVATIDDALAIAKQNA